MLFSYLWVKYFVICEILITEGEEIDGRVSCARRIRKRL